MKCLHSEKKWAPSPSAVRTQVRFKCVQPASLCSLSALLSLLSIASHYHYSHTMLSAQHVVKGTDEEQGKIRKMRLSIEDPVSPAAGDMAARQAAQPAPQKPAQAPPLPPGATPKSPPGRPPAAAKPKKVPPPKPPPPKQQPSPNGDLKAQQVGKANGSVAARAAAFAASSPPVTSAKPNKPQPLAKKPDLAAKPPLAAKPGVPKPLEDEAKVLRHPSLAALPKTGGIASRMAAFQAPAPSGSTASAKSRPPPPASKPPPLTKPK